MATEAAELAEQGTPLANEIRRQLDFIAASKSRPRPTPSQTGASAAQKNRFERAVRDLGYRRVRKVLLVAAGFVVCWLAIEWASLAGQFLGRQYPYR